MWFSIAVSHFCPSSARAHGCLHHVLQENRKAVRRDPNLRSTNAASRDAASANCDSMLLGQQAPRCRRPSKLEPVIDAKGTGAGHHLGAFVAPRTRDDERPLIAGVLRIGKFRIERIIAQLRVAFGSRDPPSADLVHTLTVPLDHNDIAVARGFSATRDTEAY